MTESPGAILGIPSFNVARLRGRTRNALIGGMFGAVWLFNGVYWGGIGGNALSTAVALCGIAFVTWPATRLRSLRRLPLSGEDSQHRIALRGPYWVDVAIECLACIGAVVWLAHTRRYDLIPQSFGVIIGLHFLPLAKIFRMPIYYATGAVMASGALASLAIPTGNVRNLSACGVIGLSLWATAAVTLWQDRLYLQKATRLNPPIT
jgi:hypothetical protein